MEERKKVLGGIDGGEEMTDPGGKGERRVASDGEDMHFAGWCV